MGIIQTTKELRPRQENDFYPTPIELCRAALGLIGEYRFDTVLDPGCGAGVWGEAARKFWPDAEITGVDIKVPYINKNYNFIHEGNFLSPLHPMQKGYYDLVIGNPPYKFAEEFIRQGRECLGLFGRMVLLLRLNFLEGQKRGKGLWKEFRPNDVYVLSRRPSYTGDRKTDATAYMIAIWRNDFLSRYDTTNLHWLDWDYDK